MRVLKTGYFGPFFQIVFKYVKILFLKVFYEENVPKRYNYCFNLLESIPK